MSLKSKPFLIAVFMFVFITGFLYGIGYVFKIDLLMLHHPSTKTEDGFHSESRSLLPVIIGLSVSYVAEKILLTRNDEFSAKN